MPPNCIYRPIVFFIFLLLSSCASKKSFVGENTKITDSAIFLTEGNGDFFKTYSNRDYASKKKGISHILELDNENIYPRIRRAIVSPGQHKFLVQQTELISNPYSNVIIDNNQAMKFDLFMEPGKRYDFIYPDSIFVRDRISNDDDTFLGDNPNKPFELLVWTNDSGFLNIDTVNKRKADALIKRENKKAEFEEILNKKQNDFLKTTPRTGEHICKKIDNAIVNKNKSAIVFINGFIDGSNDSKIKIIISGIKFRNSIELIDNEIDIFRNYKGSTISTNSIIWDDKNGWYVCD